MGLRKIGQSVEGDTVVHCARFQQLQAEPPSCQATLCTPKRWGKITSQVVWKWIAPEVARRVRAAGCCCCCLRFLWRALVSIRAGGPARTSRVPARRAQRQRTRARALPLVGGRAHRGEFGGPRAPPSTSANGPLGDASQAARSDSCRYLSRLSGWPDDRQPAWPHTMDWPSGESAESAKRASKRPPMCRPKEWAFRAAGDTSGPIYKEAPSGNKIMMFYFLPTFILQG